MIIDELPNAKASFRTQSL